MLQGQAHLVNGTLYFCHTSCDLLNEGTVEDYLRQVTAWVRTHPFDVITIIFGNYNWADKDSDGNPLVTSVDFDAPVRSSGLIDYIYQPPKTAMAVDDWPTLGQMILNQKRVVTFIDYNWDTGNVPYMLWQYYNIWETPFSPTDLSFPCTIGRPEGISDDQAKNMMYLANHNLNAEIAIAGTSLLVPNTAQINQTNAVSGEGSLGLMARECTGTSMSIAPSISRPQILANIRQREMGTTTKLPHCRLLQPRPHSWLRIRSSCTSEWCHIRSPVLW